MCPYLVFLACKVSELTGDDGLAYEVEEFILVIDILFRACHCPGKATVFGIEKQNQDVYNKDELFDLNPSPC